MRKIDERAIGRLVEIRDHPIVSECSTSLNVALTDMIEDVTNCLREKTEKSRLVYEGYVMWKSRSATQSYRLMDFERRRAASISKCNVHKIHNKNEGL